MAWNLNPGFLNDRTGDVTQVSYLAQYLARVNRINVNITRIHMIHRPLLTYVNQCMDVAMKGGYHWRSEKERASKESDVAGNID